MSLFNHDLLVSLMLYIYFPLPPPSLLLLRLHVSRKLNSSSFTVSVISHVPERIQGRQGCIRNIIEFRIPLLYLAGSRHSGICKIELNGSEKSTE